MSGGMVGDWLWVILANSLLAGGFVLLALWAGRRWNRPVIAHSLLLLALLKMVTPALIEVPVLPSVLRADPASRSLGLNSDRSASLLGTEAGATGRSATLGAATGSGVALETPSPSRFAALEAWLLDPLLALLLGSLWLAGALVSLVSGLRSARRLAEAAALADRAPRALEDQAAGIQARFGWRSAPELRVLPARLPPMLFARPGEARVLLPEELVEGLPEAQLQAVIAHEFAHFARGDHWVRWVEFLIGALYWWHPLVRFTIAELRRVEECCCDARVVELLPEARGSYARAVVATASWLSGEGPARPAFVSGMSGREVLEGRLTGILKGAGMGFWSDSRRLVLLMALGCLLPLVPVAGPAELLAREPEGRADPEEQARLPISTHGAEGTAERVAKGGDANARFAADSEAIEVAVKAGVLSELEAERKLEGLKKRWGEARYWKQAIAATSAAVKAGKLTRAEAKRKVARLKTSWAQARRWRTELGAIKEAVEDGGLTRAEADAKIAAFKEAWSKKAAWAKAAKEKIKEAADAGVLSTAEAGRKLEALEASWATELSREDQVDAIKAALQVGELSEAEAKRKLRSLEKAWGKER